MRRAYKWKWSYLSPGNKKWGAEWGALKRVCQVKALGPVQEERRHEVRRTRGMWRGRGCFWSCSEEENGWGRKEAGAWLPGQPILLRDFELLQEDPSSKRVMYTSKTSKYFKEKNLFKDV